MGSAVTDSVNLKLKILREKNSRVQKAKLGKKTKELKLILKKKSERFNWVMYLLICNVTL